MKKIASWAVSLLLVVTLLASCGNAISASGSSALSTAASASSMPAESVSAPTVPRTAFRIAGLKGPTTMGMVKLMEEAEASESRHDYTIQTYGAADEVNGLLLKGEIDVAMLPANVASVLYNKTEGKMQVAAINTLGVLYVVESGETVKSVADLAGRTIYTTGKGQTPEFVLNFILKGNGLDPEKDVDIQYKSEATEIAAMLATKENAIAVLPQPYATAVQMQNDRVRIALDLTKEWDTLADDSTLVTGVLVARTEFIQQNPEAFVEFLEDYQASIEWVNGNVKQAAELVVKYGIVEKAPIAEKALPLCNITYMAGAEMQTMLSGYLQILFEQKPEAVGGKMPDAAFYFGV